MAKYRSPTGEVIDINAELNPDLAAGKELVPDTTSLSTISSASLTPVSSVDFKTPTETPIYPVKGLDATPPATLTVPEQKADDLSTMLQGLNDSLVGESAYRTQQETALGVPELQKTQTDLSSRLKALQNEAQAIPLQLQQNSEGRGITKGGLRPIETAALRNNAIQALSTSSLLEASRGNLTTALSMVDRAVSQKYDPIREEIRAKSANLELILNSPSYTLAEKNRAQAQLDAQREKARLLDLQEANSKEIWTIATSAASNGQGFVATPQYPSLAIALKAISEAPTKEQALQIASATGLLNSPTSSGPASVQEYQFAKSQGYTGTFTQYQNEDANRKISIANAGVVTPGAPTSYKEWELAGKPGTYEQWLKDNNIKAPTIAQQTVATYAARIEQAQPVLEGAQDYISSLNPAVFEVQRRLPSYLQSEEFQSFDQAARNFINAVLRRESGAVISPSEFDNAYRQYLPRSGDTAETLQQKSQNRQVVYASLKNAAGNAYQSVDELIGQSPPLVAPPTEPTTSFWSKAYDFLFGE